MTTPPLDDTTAPRSVPALLRDPRLGPYVAAQWLSNVGNWFHSVAAGILVYDLTGSSAVVGIVGSLQFVFTLLLFPVSGQVSDRVDRRVVLLAAQGAGLTGAVGIAVAVASAGEGGLDSVWPVVAASSAIGIGYAFAVPTLQAFVPSLVPRVDLAQTLALNSMTFNLGRAVGPALAGVVVAAAGLAVAFGLNAVSFAAFAAVLLWLGRLGPRVPGADEPAPTPRAPDRSPWAAFGLARRDATVRRILVASLAVGFATDPVITLAPALAARLDGSAALVGAIGSSFGAGGALAALVVRRVRERLGPRRQARAGLVVLAVGLGVAGLAGGGRPALLGGMALAGAGFLHALTTLNTTLQLRIDDHVRGRVMALWTVSFLGVRPIASLVDGTVADLAGLTVAMALPAAGALAATLLLRPRERG